VRYILGAIGINLVLEKLAKKSKFFLWIKSLLSIYDLDDLAALDLPWCTFEWKEKVIMESELPKKM